MTDIMLWSGLDARRAARRTRQRQATSRRRRRFDRYANARTPGDLFFAIKGENNDGHDYVAAAFEKGAAACVVDEAHADALKGLGLLLRRARGAAGSRTTRPRGARSLGGAIVAVTGSVGKTGTKEGLLLVLASAGPTHASVASYNNHWGVPLTLARCREKRGSASFEIGMNHARRDHAARRHGPPACRAGDERGAGASRIFGLDRRYRACQGGNLFGLEPGGTAIVNRDNAQYEILAESARRSPAGEVLSFGVHEAADARLESFEPLDDGSRVTANVCGRQSAIGSALPAGTWR